MAEAAGGRRGEGGRAGGKDIGDEAVEQVKRAATGVIGGVKVVAKAPFKKE